MKQLFKKKLGFLSDNQKKSFLDFAKRYKKISKTKYKSFEWLLWDLYPQFVQMSVGNGIDPDQDYQKKGYKQGIIRRDHVDAFLTFLKNAQSKPISHDDHDPVYVTAENLRPYEADLNAGHKHFVLDENLLKITQTIAEELKDPLTRCLGAPWRIINVLCWETFPKALDKGPNEWHKDGLPFAVNKVMIYLTGAGETNGSTTLKLADGSCYRPEGPPGTWMLFKVSEILHKGEKPKENSRIVLEIRIVPSFTFDLRPYCAGFNAYYPKHPWHHPQVDGLR